MASKQPRVRYTVEIDVPLGETFPLREVEGQTYTFEVKNISMVRDSSNNLPVD
jgi:hypothetical protein